VKTAGRLVVLLSALLAASAARAYRPFDSTDADVVDPGEIEIELGPLGYVNEAGTKLLAAPDLVVNAGVHPRLELVLEARGLLPLEGDAPERRYRVVDTALRAKGIVRRGNLQGEAGPSVAAEIGILLPTLRDEDGLGAEAIVIASHRFAVATAHLNGAVSYTRANTWQVGVGLIVEGPAWRGVRPVAEATLAREVGEATQIAGLLGAIFEVRRGLAFDFGVRFAREGAGDVHEVRAGLTWAFDWAGGGRS
jgi:hypothetical protein